MINYLFKWFTVDIKILLSLIQIWENYFSYKAGWLAYDTREKEKSYINLCRLCKKECLPVVAMKMFHAVPANVRGLDIKNFIHNQSSKLLVDDDKTKCEVSK